MRDKKGWAFAVSFCHTSSVRTLPSYLNQRAQTSSALPLLAPGFPLCVCPHAAHGMHRSFTRHSWSPSRTRIPFWQMGFSKFTELWLNGKNPRPTPAYKERHHLSTLYIHCAPGLPISPRTTPPSAWGREQGRSVLPKSLSTLFLFLLLLLLQLPLLDTAEVGLPNATGLADGLQETGTPSRGVHHLFRGSLD